MSQAPWLEEALVTLAGVRALAAEYDEPDPTPEAVALAEQVVRALAVHVDYPKPHICCSADGGVGITSHRTRRFWKKSWTVFIEADNENDVVFCASTGKEWPSAIEVQPEDFADAAAKVAQFLVDGVIPWRREWLENDL